MIRSKPTTHVCFWILISIQISFKEYLKFQKREELIHKLGRIAEIRSTAIDKIIPEIYRHLESFLIYGGYPEVALTEPAQRREVFAGIKHKAKVSRKDLRGLKSFISAYPNIQQGYLINLNDNTSLNNIRLLSPFDLDRLTAC